MRVGPDEEGGVSNPVIFLLIVTVSLYWQRSRGVMASPWVSGSDVLLFFLALKETRENEDVEMRKRKWRGYGSDIRRIGPS